MLCRNSAITANQECDRQSQNASVRLRYLFIPQSDGVVHLELLVELADRLRIIVHGNTNHLQALLAILVLELHKAGDFISAGRTPRRPEVEQYHFASVVGEVKRLRSEEHTSE